MAAEASPELESVGPHEGLLRAAMGLYAVHQGYPREVHEAYVGSALQKTEDDPERRLSLVRNLVTRLTRAGVEVPEEIVTLTQPTEVAASRPAAIPKARPSRKPALRRSASKAKATVAEVGDEDDIFALLDAEVGEAPAIIENNVDDLDVPAQTADLVRLYLNEIGKVPLLDAAQEVVLSRQIEAGVFAREKLDLLDAGLIAPDDLPAGATREELVEIARLGEQAKDHMIRANLRLVVSLAKRRPTKGMPFLDLVQEGNTGLIRAVEKFDYTKGYKFSTYATWWIRQSLGRGVADQARTVRLPVHVIEKLGPISRYVQRFESEQGRQPTNEEVAKHLNLKRDTVSDIRRAALGPLSLDSPIGEKDGSTLMDVVAAAQVSVEIKATEQDLDDARAALEALLADANLSEREKGVLFWRYGLHDGTSHTLDEIGRHFGVTREAIRQADAKALAKIRAVISEDPSKEEAFQDLLEAIAG